MPTLLIVEDDVNYRREIQRNLLERRPDIKVLFATYLHEVPDLLSGNHVDLIVWDERLPDGRATNRAIPETAKTFRGPMIANSDLEASRRLQLQVGCTHTKGATGLTSLVLELLANIS